MQIRILHIVTYMGRGGLETMLMNYYRSIDRTKVQFDFLAHRDFRADYDDEIEALGGKIYRLPSLNPFSRAYLGALDRFFAEHPEYRIVHSHLDCMSAIPLKAAKKHGVPVRIAHAHSTGQHKDLKYILKLFFKRQISCCATHLFACSEEAGKWMFCRENVPVLRNSIDARLYAYDPDIRTAVRAELGFSSDDRVIGHVGRFDGPKNQKFLIELLRQLPESCRLLLVGDGELRRDVEQLAERYALRHRVCFAGIRSDVPQLLQAMDVFVFPSLYEGFGNVAVEAQAAGLPCVISDGVPPSCMVTDRVVRLPLGAGAAQWADEAAALACRPRTNTTADIIRAGFDSEENARHLESFYLTSHRRHS